MGKNAGHQCSWNGDPFGHIKMLQVNCLDFGILLEFWGILFGIFEIWMLGISEISSYDLTN